MLLNCALQESGLSWGGGEGRHALALHAAGKRPGVVSDRPKAAACWMATCEAAGESRLASRFAFAWVGVTIPARG